VQAGRPLSEYTEAALPEEALCVKAEHL